MDFKGISRENKIYLLIAFFILIIILFTAIISSSSITEAYVKDDALGNDWYEDIDERYLDSQLFNLEKQASFTYQVDNSTYPSFLTVNTYKTIFMMNEKELFEKTIESIESYAKTKNLSLYHNSSDIEDRTLLNGHKTKHIIYNGSISKKEGIEKIKIIGETWNCEKSGTSIIVVGFSQITNSSVDSNKKYLGFWNEIIKEDGLIYNVKCH